VGSKTFIERMKELLGVRAKGRDVLAGSEGYQLLEGAASYKALLVPEKSNIGHENTYFWDIKFE
jgi:hypothetical protein